MRLGLLPRDKGTRNKAVWASALYLASASWYLCAMVILWNRGCAGLMPWECAVGWPRYPDGLPHCSAPPSLQGSSQAWCPRFQHAGILP